MRGVRMPPPTDPEKVETPIDRKRTHRLGAVRGVVAKTISDLARLRLQLAREVVIRAQDGEAFLGQAFDEPLKKIAHGAEVAEVVRMVELDVGHDRPLRVMKRERAVRLVGLSDQPLRLPCASARSVTDEDRRVVAGGGEDVAEHVRDCRLASGAGDGDRIGLVDQAGEHLGTADDSDSHRARSVKLG